MTDTQKYLPSPEERSLSDERQESTSILSRGSFCRRLNRGPDARAQFVESHINKGIAYQLRAMREAREWSQEQLAIQVGMPQTAISRLESSSYGKPTITTLKRMARVYDVALDVRFVPFSKFLNRILGIPYTEYGLSSDALDVPSFEEETEQAQQEVGVAERKPPRSELNNDSASAKLAATGKQTDMPPPAVKEALSDGGYSWAASAGGMRQ